MNIAKNIKENLEENKTLITPADQVKTTIIIASQK